MVQSGLWAIGVDLGGTKTVVARVSADGRIDERIRISTDVQGGPSSVLKEIVAAARELRRKDGSAPVGMGVGIAGQIDEERGVVRFAPNLGWHDVAFGPALSTSLELPVILMNDVRAATWGEWLHGSGRGTDDIVCVFAGTGVGGGVVSGGRMLTGCTNTLGEIGHMTIDLDGPQCTCRNSGCLEALAGGWAIARNAQEAVKGDPGAGAYLLKQAGGELGSITGSVVGQAALAGDPLAVRIMDEAGRALAAGAVSLVNAFNPCRLILGGGVIEGMPDLVDRIKEGVRKRALAAARERLEIVPALLREDAGVIGMGACALRTAAEQQAGRSAA